MSDDDTIITFNYDTAVEELAARAGCAFERHSLCLAEQPGRPRLIKLHGSVDWIVQDEHVKYLPHAYYEETDLAMATPGLAKSRQHSAGHFYTLMKRAEHAIETADLVSIVGYSMPPSDHKAKLIILDSIASVRNFKQQINLVLGPDSGGLTARRMVAMIQPHVKCQVIDHPLYAQDYLPYVDRHCL